MPVEPGKPIHRLHFNVANLYDEYWLPLIKNFLALIVDHNLCALEIARKKNSIRELSGVIGMLGHLWLLIQWR